MQQRLLDIHGRSPDPDKVAKEMQCDKGLGKRKPGLQRSNVTQIEGFVDDTLEEQFSHSQSQRSELQEYISKDHNGNNKVVQRNVSHVRIVIFNYLTIVMYDFLLSETNKCT